VDVKDFSKRRKESPFAFIEKKQARPQKSDDDPIKQTMVYTS
jgi:hypothetical protein